LGVTIPYALRLVKQPARRGANFCCNRWENMAMDKTIPKGKIVISLHQLYVEVAHEASYPDQMHDMSSRALQLFTTALTIAKDSGMDIRDFDFQDFEDDDEDDD
jgi:hypothetical protein